MRPCACARSNARARARARVLSPRPAPQPPTGGCGQAKGAGVQVDEPSGHGLPVQVGGLRFEACERARLDGGQQARGVRRDVPSAHLRQQPQGSAPLPLLGARREGDVVSQERRPQPAELHLAEELQHDTPLPSVLAGNQCRAEGNGVRRPPLTPHGVKHCQNVCPLTPLTRADGGGVGPRVRLGALGLQVPEQGQGQLPAPRPAAGAHCDTVRDAAGAEAPLLHL
mmetsp:Transcript_23435/g.73036  ORF Transcript_23435/g.73036 Transcript_23435/m.73036 type:complete len:226 (+) Transcript_23435:34-711(+)